MPDTLPILAISEQITQVLDRSNRLVVAAPTGSGKTTQIPQVLHAMGLDRIVVLQPRRLATRIMAVRVAQELHTPVGSGLVGYQTRHDSHITDANAIRFMTEGLFLRLMQSEPALPGVGAVVLDEFHERSVALDVSLALVRRLQETHRPDLRLVVMSATLDVQRVRDYLNCQVLETTGRAFPVDVHYLAHRSDQPIWEQAAGALQARVEQGGDGDVLIFMPGAYEIHRTIRACQRVAGDWSVVGLHGSMPPIEQDAALAPSPRRKVIVSTNVAETSITIEGVVHVIDSGLARVNRFDPRRGISAILIEPISQASADQRAGRAGRTQPGTCLRLWTQFEHRTRPAHTTPEIQRLDLAQVLLQLQSLAVADAAHFPWLQPPDQRSVDQAQDVLAMLGAVTEQPGDGGENSTSRLTSIGAVMAELPMHPRLGRMLVEADRRGCLHRAALWAALISERDIFLSRDGWRRFAEAVGPDAPTDFLVLERAMDAAGRSRFAPGQCASMGLSATACREVDRTARLFRSSCRSAGLDSSTRDGDRLDDLLKCLLIAFPDHLAVRRSQSNRAVALAGKRKGVLDGQSVVGHADLLLAVDMRETERRGSKGPAQSSPGGEVQVNVSLASRIDRAWLAELLPDRLSSETITVWDDQKKAAQTVVRTRFDDLVLDQTPRHETDMDAAAQLLAEMVSRGQLKLERWDEVVEQWIARTRFVAAVFPERKLITYDQHDRQVLLLELCSGLTRASQLRDRPVLDVVKNALSWDDQRFVEQMAPAQVTLPSGRRMKLSYEPPTERAGLPPIVRGRAKIQDLYGLTQTPRIAGGRCPVLLEILGPNMRPVQVTDDLANFWANLYPTLRKELARRYPKHEWR